MTRVVKGVRPYVSKRRQQAAEATKQAILDAARQLFEEHGYGATSMQSIAEDAEVAVKTIYLAFGGKAALLREMWGNCLAPGEAEIPVLERRWYRDVLDDNNPRQRVRLLVEHSVAVKTRSAALLEVIRNAASADTEVRDLWTEIDNKLRHVANDFVKQLSNAGALRPGLTIRYAADALWALNHPTMWQLLVVQQSWTTTRYALWLDRTLATELLAEDGAPTR
jgi:AcrR family transcriptional regulator